MGEQVRGFGFLHDGSMDTLLRFHHGPRLQVDFPHNGPSGIPVGPEGMSSGGSSRPFLLAFPLAGRPSWASRSRSPGSAAAVGARVDLLRRRADAGECEPVAKARIAGDEAGFLYMGSGRPVTYACVPLGSGERVGVDRDGNGAWDGDERDAPNRSGRRGQQALIRARDAWDLPQEILDHPSMGEEEPVAEVVRFQDFRGRTLPRNIEKMATNILKG